MKENGGTILRPRVRALPIHLRGLVENPEGLQQFFIAYLRGVEGYLNDFGVAGLVGADVLVGRILSVPVRIADGCIHNTWNHAKFCFHSPEASCRERGNFRHLRLLCSPLYSTFESIVDKPLDARRPLRDSRRRLIGLLETSGSH